MGQLLYCLRQNERGGRKNLAGKLSQADAATGTTNPGKNTLFSGQCPQAGQEQSEPLFCLLGASLPSPSLPRSFPWPERRLQKVPPLPPATVCRGGREWAEEKPRPPLKLKGGSGVNADSRSQETPVLCAGCELYPFGSRGTEAPQLLSSRADISLWPSAYRLVTGPFTSGQRNGGCASILSVPQRITAPSCRLTHCAGPRGVSLSQLQSQLLRAGQSRLRRKNRFHSLSES